MSDSRVSKFLYVVDESGRVSVWWNDKDISSNVKGVQIDVSFVPPTEPRLDGFERLTIGAGQLSRSGDIFIDTEDGRKRLTVGSDGTLRAE